MNRKATLFIIAAVAAILPAVAVADVMITGEVSLVGSQNTPVFILQPGPNYPAAHGAGAINFGTGPVAQCTTPPDGGQTIVTTEMATVDIQGITNQTTYLINVVDLNITKGTGTLWLNLTSSTLPVGTMILIQGTLMTFSDLTTNGIEIGSDVTVPLNLATLSVTTGDTFYIGFYMPPGTYAGTSATILGTFMTTPPV